METKESNVAAQGASPVEQPAAVQPRKAMTLADAKQEVEQLIKRLTESSEATEVKIHLWWEDNEKEMSACVGVRISEISWIEQKGSGICGSTCFAGSPESLGFVAAAERCIIERMVCTCSDDDWDSEIKEADWRLEMLVHAEVTFKPATPQPSTGSAT